MKQSLSIVIPTYNRPTLLRRAVESAQVACPPDGEIIVVDDRSDTAVLALTDFKEDVRLKVVTNTGAKGAAGARNFGAEMAKGSILLFFDDDDTLVADYPARVLAAATEGADWGFSALTATENDRIRHIPRENLSHGLIPDCVPLKDKTAAFSAGFWVRAAVFKALGEIASDLVNDEDTDFCCRLHASKYSAWFEPEPGCHVYRGYDTGTTTAPQLTQSTDPEIMVRCYMQTFQRNNAAFAEQPADRWFLLRRALRVAAREGTDHFAYEMLRNLKPRHWQVKGWLFWQLKKLGTRLR
ncbi:glycosyltransferase family 2 protein [Loktanella sp. S4079]|uniref:glycosyltransferase family 2 protein n=1 Tax=Loktanella sp. S4079 TaxID=579483 RepID=UPI0005F9BC66|nr:glycosyltransferase family 2 protein [Loktanella sp. S4079]KJZ21114.1 hypothetical protein TW80_00180 [Loktanella sp. S4079]